MRLCIRFPPPPTTQTIALSLFSTRDTLPLLQERPCKSRDEIRDSWSRLSGIYSVVICTYTLSLSLSYT